jgi:hypothetical protein
VGYHDVPVLADCTGTIVPTCSRRPPLTDGNARNARQQPGAALTAQRLYPKIFKELIGPALQDLGFDNFRYVNGDCAGLVSAQKSHYNTKDKVDFTIHLGAVYTPTGYGYWHPRLPMLIPGRHRGWWTLQTGQPIEPTAQDIMTAFHAYGWPAILAAVDSPGYPPDPAALWARTFPREPGTAPRQASLPLTERPRPANDTDPEINELFTEVTDANRTVRLAATETIVEFASEDPRTVPALLHLLEWDADEYIRKLATLGLAPSADREQVREALRAAAAEDEDLQVRWAARYAIRLATRNQDQGTQDDTTQSAEFRGFRER